MEPDPSLRAPRSQNPWPRALMWTAIVAMVVGGGLYVFRSLRDLPGRAAERGLETLERLSEVAAAFRQGTVTTTFHSYATRATGSARFQFATLEQTEVFRRTDEASVLWGRLELPEVVVEATAPVTTSYYLDLDAPWELVLEGRTITVYAPAIEFNKPAVDASEIHYRALATSALRDEEAAIEQLRRGITAMSVERARENVGLVRELGRRRTAEFVRTWLAGSFGDGEDYRVEVVFADEVPGEELGALKPLLAPAAEE